MCDDTAGPCHKRGRQRKYAAAEEARAAQNATRNRNKEVMALDEAATAA